MGAIGPMGIGLAARMLVAGAASAEPTRITVRVLSRNAKFVGTTMGGTQVVIRDAQTGAVLVEGLARGETGDTERIVKPDRKRGVPIRGRGQVRGGRRAPSTQPSPAVRCLPGTTPRGHRALGRRPPRGHRVVPTAPWPRRARRRLAGRGLPVQRTGHPADPARDRAGRRLAPDPAGSAGPHASPVGVAGPGRAREPLPAGQQRPPQHPGRPGHYRQALRRAAGDPAATGAGAWHRRLATPAGARDAGRDVSPERGPLGLRGARTGPVEDYDMALAERLVQGGRSLGQPPSGARGKRVVPAG